MFCSKCGSLLRSRELKNNSFERFCSCGYVEKTKENMHFKEEIKNEDKPIVVHNAEDNFADYEHVCGKCGHNKAYLVQRVSIETEEMSCCDDITTEVICGKCGRREKL